VRRNFPKVTTLLTQQGHVIQLIENFTYFEKMQNKSVVHKKAIFLISIENTNA
jgi:hypothetical protein